MSIWQGEGRRLWVNEVGTRDSLQAECHFVLTGDKIALIDALSQTGVAKIEVSASMSLYGYVVPGASHATVTVHARSVRQLPVV